VYMAVDLYSDPSTDRRARPSRVVSEGLDAKIVVLGNSGVYNTLFSAQARLYISKRSFVTGVGKTSLLQVGLARVFPSPLYCNFV
jgi:hypothetical protein